MALSKKIINVTKRDLQITSKFVLATKIFQWSIENQNKYITYKLNPMQLKQSNS